MSESAIRDYAKARGFHTQTLERWLSWQPSDQVALAELAVALKIGENHLRDLMDWLEEIALRDDAQIHQILGRKILGDITTDPRLGRADKLKRVKEQVRRWRFPRLAETEDAIREKIQALKLHPTVRLSVPPGLEGGRLQVEFSAASHEELKQLSAKLSDALAKAVSAEIFELLSGARPEKDRK
jgi:hypothetical protein